MPENLDNYPSSPILEIPDEMVNEDNEPLFRRLRQALQDPELMAAAMKEERFDKMLLEKPENQ